MPEQTGKMVDAVGVSCSILNILRSKDRAGVTEIADEVGMAKGAVYRHLTTLNNYGYIVNENGKYRLSFCYLDMATHAREMVGNYSAIEAELEELADKTGEIAQFATEEHEWVTYICKVESEAGLQTASAPGRREYMHSTALGKAMLAEMTSEKARSVINRHGMPAKTDTTLSTESGLMDELETVADRGYAIDDEENIDGLRCIAMPVMDGGSTVIGAVSVSGPASRMTDERIANDLADLLARSTNVIEINSQFS